MGIRPQEIDEAARKLYLISVSNFFNIYLLKTLKIHKDVDFVRDFISLYQSMKVDLQL